jgi:small-conductance mechanosensitive channel
MNITQINTAILQGGWTNDQLTSIIDAVKFARARLMEQNKRALRLGDRVSFRSSKTGMTVTGTVNKIAIKFVTVSTAQGLWRVPANMLSPVMDAELA